MAELDKSGTTISDVGATSSHSNSAITGTGFWLLTLLDALLMCGGAWGVVAKQANAPFCTACDTWHGVELTVSRLHPNQAPEAARLASEGKFAELGGLRNAGATQKSYCDVLLTKCPGCATGNLSVKRALNNQIKTLWSGAVSPPQVKELEAVRAQWLQ